MRKSCKILERERHLSRNLSSVCVQDLVSLVVASLEKEGVRMMRECEPRELRGVGGDGEEGRVEVSWYNKTTGEREQVCHGNLY